MAPPFDLLVRGGTCAIHGSLRACDLGITGGRIVAVGALAGAAAERELDATNLHVLPGVLDTGGYLRDEGGSAQVLGGVTAVFDAHPHPTTAAGLEDKLSRARGRAHCDYAFFIAAATDHLDDLDRLERLPGCSGVVLSVTTDDEPLHRALFCGQRRVTVSCEPDPHPEPVAAGAAVDLYRDEDVDDGRALQRFLNMAKRAGRRAHVSNVASEAALGLLLQHRELATVGVAAADLDLAMPTAEALWRAVTGGLVDALGSGPERSIASSHLLLPAMLEHVHAGRLGLPQLVELLSSGPARIYNVARKGRLALGFDADLVLVDLAAAHIHAGVRLHGWPVVTVLRGEIVAREGRIVSEPTGAPVRFSDTLRMVVL